LTEIIVWLLHANHIIFSKNTHYYHESLQVQGKLCWDNVNCFHVHFPQKKQN